MYLLVSFKKFKLTSSSPEGWCDLPKGYRRVKLDDVLSSSAFTSMPEPAKSPEAGNASENPREPSFTSLTRDAIDF